MKAGKKEDRQQRGTALRKADSGLSARRHAERQLLDIKEALERKSAALGASEQRYRATFQQVSMAIGMADMNNRFTEVNQAFCDIIGYSPDELRGMTFIDITHPDDVEESRALVTRLRNGEIPRYTVEKRYIRKDREIVWSRTTVSLVRGAKGKPEQFIGTIEDITDRRRAEEALEAAAQRLQLALAAAELGDWSWDARTDVISLGARAAEIFGVPREMPATWAQLRERLSPQDRARDRHAVEEALRNWSDYNIEYRVADAAGRERWIAVRGRGAYADNGAVTGMIGVVEDITQVKRTELVSARLAAIVASSSDAIISKTLDGVITTWNQGAEHIFGYTAEEAIGKPVTMLIPPEQADEEPRILEKLRRGERIEHFETTRMRKDGTRLTVSLSVSPIKNADGTVVGASKIARDISQQKKAEAALREANRRKDEFLATLAHELRNPLAPIRQAALISKAAAATEEQKLWSHDVIDRQVHQMALLLDDLLDISRITRGTLELRLEMTDLRTIVETAAETARPAVDAKEHVFTVEIPDEPVQLAADPLRLAQVLSNLLTNAAKYTDPRGRIELRAACEADVVTISVADNGIGIPSDSLSAVFTMFSQVKTSQDRSEGGLGIGLALAKGLIELHQGTIEAQSEGVGRGSTFVVRLPRRTLDAVQRREVAETAITPSIRRRVLIADDNRAAADSLAVLLEMEGHEVKVVYDGQQALTALSTMESGVALLDIGMPKVNGYDVARRVRQGPHGRSVTLIAVTGWGRDADRARALEAGFDRHFTKPVDVMDLIELLRSPGAEN